MEPVKHGELAPSRTMNRKTMRATYQNFLSVTYPPSQPTDVSVRKHNRRGKVNTKHMPDSIHNTPRILAISFDMAAKALVRIAGRNIRVAVQAVADNGQESRLDGTLTNFSTTSTDVDASVLVVELGNLDLERLRDGHDVMSATVVVTELEHTLCPPELVTLEDHLALDEIRVLRLFLHGLVPGENALVGGGIVLARVGWYPAAKRRNLGDFPRAVVCDHVKTDPVLLAVLGGGGPLDTDRGTVLERLCLDILQHASVGAFLSSGLLVGAYNSGTSQRQAVVLGIIARKVSRNLGKSKTRGVLVEQSRSILDNGRRSGSESGASSLNELIDEVLGLFQDLVNALLPLGDRGRQRTLDELGDTGIIAQVAAIDLLHVRLLDIREERKSEEVAGKSHEENGAGPGNEGSAPQTSGTKDTFGVIEEAVDGGISELPLAVEEEIAIEPSEFA